MKLIMLCGQGGIGKSTYGKWLVNQLNNAILLRLDDIVRNSNSKECHSSHIEQFYQLVKNTIIEKKYENIILDFCHDVKANRKKALNNILTNLNNSDIEFITISLRPGYENIIKWRELLLTKNKTLTLDEIDEQFHYFFTDDFKKRVKKIYNDFQPPVKDEFKDYNFKSTTHIIIDNSKPYERLFW